MRPSDLRPSRRTFVKGLAAGGVVTALGLGDGPAWGQRLGARLPSTVLTGTQFDLRIVETPVNFTGQPSFAHTVNGSLPAPTLRWKEGDTVTLRVANHLGDGGSHASIHWHGILLPANMDGVPGLSFNGIRPGEAYVYRFHVRQAGTYWYHSHSAFEEQRGVYGPLIIDPRQPAPFAYDREHVVMLSDWTDEVPERVFAKLKKQSDYYNFHKRTVIDFFRDVGRKGLASTFADRAAWGEMRMSPTDLADVSGHTYTYLMNGTTPAGAWTGLFRPGERVRLRFINGSSMTPGLVPAVLALVLAAAPAGTPLTATGRAQVAERPAGSQDPHAGHHQDPRARHVKDSGAPKEPIPPITDADREAAFPDVQGHAVHDRAVHYFVLFDQLEWQSGGKWGIGWDTQGWAGGDTNRLWFRTEGEGEGGSLEEAQAQLFYGRAVARWWDLVVGIRHDMRPGPSPSRTWAAVGIQGLAPYWFEVEATAYIGTDGRMHARLETEYELLLTNRLILQPLVEVEIHSKSDPERRIGAGLSTIETGTRLRYEVRREFAPYIGLTWSTRLFGTATLAREAGADVSRRRLVLGVRTWF